MPPTRACDTCFKQKIQCLRSGPGLPCNWCGHHDLECTFTREDARRSKKRNSRENKLLERIRQLEQALGIPQHLKALENPRRLESTPCETHDKAFHGKTKEPSCEDHGVHPHICIASHIFERNWYHQGFPFVSDTGMKWIATMTRSDTTTLRSYCLSKQNNLPCGFQPMPDHSGSFLDLPDRSLVQQWFASLSGTSFQIIFPALDKVLFQETIDLVYKHDDPLDFPEFFTARSCLWATFAIVALFRRTGSFPASESRETCAKRAQYFLAFHIDNDNPTTDIHLVQAYFLLHKYRMAIGQYETASFMISGAFRDVLKLKGHLDCPVDHGSNAELSLPERRQRHLRKLFWLCRAHRNDLTFPYKLAFRGAFTNRKYDLNDPEKYLGHEVFLEGPGDAVDIEAMGSIAWDRVLSFLPGDPHLWILKEKSYDLLYSHDAREVIDSDLLVRIRQLDAELESWRLAVPSAIRPKLSMVPIRGVLWNHTFPSYLRSVQLQLEYHLLLTIIHTPVRRFGATQGVHSSLPEELHRAMHSSIDLSLEASRSTLRLIKEPIALVRQDTFWRATIYPIVAALSLFLNVLLHPFVHGAAADTALIVSAAEVVDNLREGCVTEYEKRHVEQTSEFLRVLAMHANGILSTG